MAALRKGNGEPVLQGIWLYAGVERRPVRIVAWDHDFIQAGN